MKKSIILLLGVFLLTGCEDFLTENPKTQIFVDNYFQTPEDARAIVNGTYRTGVPGFYGAGSAYSGSTIMMGGYMSGLFDNEYKGQEVHVQNTHNLTLDAINMAGYFGGQWASLYQAISRANTAIKYVPQTEGLGQAEMNSLLAQARFFRALNYFYLVRVWGDVPLITEPYESLENIYVERTPARDVYEQILSDLEWADQNGGLNDVPFPHNNFRVTKGAVNTLKADVQLHMAGYPLQIESGYQSAATTARGIISSGVYELISHGPTPEQSAYNVLRTSDTESEYIYSIEFVANISSSGRIPGYSYPNRMASFGVFTYDITNNAYRPVDEIVRVYDPEFDLRIQEQQFFHTRRVIDGELYEYELSPYLFHDTAALFETNQGTKDQNVYRYAELLLIAAEAIARSEGVTAEAVSYLTDVRSRAYWQTDRSVIENALSGLSVQDFVEEVWKERLREFSLEFKVWFDIQRTRQYPTTQAGDPGEVNFVNVIGHTNPWGSVFQEHHLLFPLSNNDLQTNPNLRQNPGY